MEQEFKGDFEAKLKQQLHYPKHQLNGLDQWEAIEKQLIIDDVWNNLAEQLDEKENRAVGYSKKRVFFYLTGLLIVVMAAIFALPDFDQQSIPKAVKKPLVVKSIQQKEVLKSIEKDDVNDVLDVKAQGKRYCDSLTFEKNTLLNHVSEQNENNMDSILEVGANETFRELGRKQLIPSWRERVQGNQHWLYVQPKNTVKYWGINVFTSNTLPMGNSFIYGLKRNSLVRNNFSWGISLGIHMNRPLGARYLLTGGIDLFSRMKFSQSVFRNGTYDRDETEFRYIKMKAGISRNFAPTNTYLGVEYFVSQFYPKDNATFNYKNIDFGLSIRMGKAFNVVHQTVQFNLRTDLGLRNIHSVSGSFEKVRTLNTGIELIYFLPHSNQK